MKRVLTVLILTAALSPLSGQGTATRTERITFIRYPATHVDVPSARKKAIIHKGDGTFRTRLRWTTQGKPNFADHLRIETWGCGTGCILFGLADLTTGSTYLFPESLSAPGDGRRLKFELTSRAVHLVGYFNEGKPADRWYAWTGNALKLIRDTPLPEECFSPAEEADKVLPTSKCNFQPLEEEIDGQPAHNP